MIRGSNKPYKVKVWSQFDPRRKLEMKILAAFLLCVTVFVVSCSADKPKASNSESASPAAPGRADSRSLEAAGVVGYDGAAIRRSVDKALNQNDARNAETKKAIDQATEK
jgi:hypothetical protein